MLITLLTTANNQRFEDLLIWKLGKELFRELGLIFYSKSFRNFSFQDQIMRATLSITNNIAEGFERE
jgi:four helix bundle protein